MNNNKTDIIDKKVKEDYKYGFVTDIESETLPPGISEEEIQFISKIKKLETKNSLLTDNLDLDYIEFLIRDKFLLGNKSETVYIIKNNDN